VKNPDDPVVLTDENGVEIAEQDLLLREWSYVGIFGI